MLKNKTQKIFNFFILVVLLTGFSLPLFAITIQDGAGYYPKPEQSEEILYPIPEQPSTTNVDKEILYPIHEQPSTTNVDKEIFYPIPDKSNPININEDDISKEDAYVIKESQTYQENQQSKLEGISTDGTATYTLLEQSLPNIPATSNNMGKYLEGIFNLAIGIATALAVLMIVIGGFKYITSEGVSYTTEAKKQITDALIGLILVLASWIILNTINTDLVNFSTNLPTVKYIAPTSRTSDAVDDDYDLDAGVVPEGYEKCWCRKDGTTKCQTVQPSVLGIKNYTFSSVKKGTCGK